MAVRIRMKRMGRKHRPFYRVCVIDGQKAREGRAIEEVGTYDPMVHDKSQRVKLNLERIEYWISVGAQPSHNVATMIKKVKTGRFGAATAPPPMQEPKPIPVAQESSGAEETENAEATAAE
ncbi:MAG: 30S ribosomal protein S16 [Planctomycetaceae bacterium]